MSSLSAWDLLSNIFSYYLPLNPPPNQVGPRIASQPAVTASLVALLSSHNFSESEELVLNCICALTNLSYYHREDNQVRYEDELMCISNMHAITNVLMVC